MLAYAIAIGAALLVVPLTAGTFQRLLGLRLHRAWMLLAGLGLQVLLEVAPIPRARYDDLGFVLLLGSYVLVLGFGLSNLRVLGMGVVMIGIALNAFVIALNGGMPYRAPAGMPRETTVKHRPERRGDLLPVLGDRIALGAPFDVSISFGDLVVAVGLVDLCYRNSRRSRRDRARVRHPAEALPVGVPIPGRTIDLAALERALAEGGEAPGLAARHDTLERGEHPAVVDVARS